MLREIDTFFDNKEEPVKIDHPNLIIENRSRMKILLIDPTQDLPIETINAILKTAIGFYN